MFSEKLGLTLLFSILVWLGATLFFVFFGSMVLVDPYQQDFFMRFLLLEIATAVVLYIVFVIFRKLDPSPYAVVKLGLIGSAVGLIIDAFVLWNRDVFFSGLSSEQLLAFTIWMSFAYGLYLLIPLFMRKENK
ncbi:MULTISPECIES: hypothetical protein [Bacillales]|jgi:hypothetical protein|uniref:DUF5367 domain-containing protein n=1 Tax=Brevibacillus aydinogluensis TaxID=927786 RepID=A0AA48RC21_9BACL|nr:MULTISPECIES: hypothetical protein [Bacillales]REK68241.1 MAG: hypothetical protein DF221_00120 [Brevibacillus sp.]MBR8661240.1 hypothetical protein [Brevibacillus sp. NL20B1]MDT3415167.1 cell division protein FtsX [Brevibacillus aydinogluensis]NNV01679.1 hypothetical protein [Brevibacillus sp. MCWH]UFJ60945.1 hypothetical protein IRT44_17100 [Anoxybacillus sediminis]